MLRGMRQGSVESGRQFGEFGGGSCLKVLRCGKMLVYSYE